VTDKTGILQRELDELQAQINTLERNLEEKPDYGLGQGATAITQWELDQTLLQQLKTEAMGIERTQMRMGSANNVESRSTPTAWQSCRIPRYAFGVQKLARAGEEINS